MIGWLFGSGGEVDRLRAEIRILRHDAREAAALIEKLDGDRDEVIEKVAALHTDRDSLAERLAISQREELAQRREVERLRAVLREIGTAAEAAVGNEPVIPANGPAHSVSFPAHSGSFGGWVDPEARLPDGHDIEDEDSGRHGSAAVLVASRVHTNSADVEIQIGCCLHGQFLDWGCNPIRRVVGWMPLPEWPQPADPIARQPDPRAIAGQSSGQSGWIRVADALPDYHDEEVVALAGGQPVLAHYSPEGGWHDCYWRDLSGVTHWSRWPEGSGSGWSRLSGWTSVNERLPDVGVTVWVREETLTAPPRKGQQAYLDECGNWRWAATFNHVGDFEVTHWQWDPDRAEREGSGVAGEEGTSCP